MKFLQGFLKWFKFKRIKQNSVIKDISSKNEINLKSLLTSKNGERTLNIHVGLDFGTSTTKIAYAYSGHNPIPILFPYNTSQYPNFCLPTLVAFDENNNLLLGHNAAHYLSNYHWDTGIRRLKVLVAGKYDKSFYDELTTKAYDDYIKATIGEQTRYIPEHFTVAFLVYAMRKARDEIKSIYTNRELNILYNICMPIDHIENNKAKSVFEKIFAVAEKVEKDWSGNINNLLENILNIYDKIEYAINDSTRVFAVPEAIAEIASYLVSLRLRDGIHAIIDFGAGTTDISIFNIKYAKEADQKSFCYSANNIPRGTRFIERIISNLLNLNNELEIIKILNNINRQSSNLQNSIREEIELLWRKTIPAWQKGYSHLANQNFFVRNKVQIFISGGGARNSFIEKIFSQSWMDNWGPYPIEIIPAPDDYNINIPFERMAVAYGLTIPIPKLGNFNLPSNSPNHKPPPIPKFDPFGPFDDKLIPNANWL